jgi:hypothetical protein
VGVGIREDNIFAISYGGSHNKNTRFSKDIRFLMKSPGIVSAKLNGIIGFWTFFLISEDEFQVNRNPP